MSEHDDDLPRGYGSLGGDGVDHHDKVATKVVNEGIENKMHCDRCGRPLLVTIPWAELIFMGNHVLPTNGAWRHEPAFGCFMPTTGCPRCGDQVRLGITPDECGRHVKAGVAAGKITGAAVAQYSQQITGQRR